PAPTVRNSGAIMDNGLTNELLYQNKPIQYWLEALKHEDPAVREQAAAAWRRISQPLRAAVPLLISSMKDPSFVVRVKAIAALGDLGEQAQSIVPSLRAALKETALRDTEEAIRASAVQALTQIGPQAETQLPVLIDA